jgi:predicted extracellular nuclease
MLNKTTRTCIAITGGIILFVMLVTGPLHFNTLKSRNVTKIHTIQGSGAISPEVGKIHTIEGVVIGDFQGSHKLKGFFVQEEESDVDADPMTSEGIFVYAPMGTDVKIGDVVRVTGKVTEFHESTELQNIRQLTVIGTAASLPAATNISLPLANGDFLERYEGMLVIFPQRLTVTENYYLGQYGQISLSSGGRLMTPTDATKPGATAKAMQAANDLNRIIVDDGSHVANPDPISYPAPGLSASHTLRIGDTVTDVTGVITYSFDHYRLHPIVAPAFVSTNGRPGAPTPVGGTLKVAGFNIRNYFTTIDNGSNRARGANSTTEFIRQRAKILATIKAIDADILGIMELENDETVSITNLVDGLNEAVGAGTYAYISTGKIGRDAIRVAILYKPGVITPVGTYMVDTNPIFDRPSLAQTFEDSVGEKFTIVVNHFKSKRCNDASGANFDQGDGQGCYNYTRTMQATRLLSFIDTVVIPTSGDPDVLILGDLNAYAKEDPIATIKNAGYTNLIDYFMGESAYSYVFLGQSGYLGHALASGTLMTQVTGVTVWHINADEPCVLDYNEEYKSPGQLVSLYNADPFRSSDHDPVLIGIHLNRLN